MLIHRIITRGIITSIAKNRGVEFFALRYLSSVVLKDEGRMRSACLVKSLNYFTGAPCEHLSVSYV